MASPGTKPAPAVDTASLESNRGGSIEATPHPGECKASDQQLEGRGLLGNPQQVPLVGLRSCSPFPTRGWSRVIPRESCPVMRSGNLEEREEDAPAVQHLPAPLARLRWEQDTGKKQPALGLIHLLWGFKGLWRPRAQEGGLPSALTPGPTLSFPGSWPMTGVMAPDVSTSNKTCFLGLGSLCLVASALLLSTFGHFVILGKKSRCRESGGRWWTKGRHSHGTSTGLSMPSASRTLTDGSVVSTVLPTAKVSAPAG